MPRASITFDDGTRAELVVTSFATENDESLADAIDGSRARISRGRDGVRVSIDGYILYGHVSTTVDTAEQTIVAAYGGRAPTRSTKGKPKPVPTALDMILEDDS